MFKKFSLHGNYKWIDISPDSIKKSNAKVHRMIGMKLKDVTLANKRKLLKKFFTKSKRKKKPRFKKGDSVHISKTKHIFEKGYTPDWTTEIFTIVRVAPTNPVTYHIKDYEGQIVRGGFYEQELLKAKYPDVYLVEKVLKRRKNQLYVKYLGFDNSHNQLQDKNLLGI